MPFWGISGSRQSSLDCYMRALNPSSHSAGDCGRTSQLMSLWQSAVGQCLQTMPEMVSCNLSAFCCTDSLRPIPEGCEASMPVAMAAGSLLARSCDSASAAAAKSGMDALACMPCTMNELRACSHTCRVTTCKTGRKRALMAFWPCCSGSVCACTGCAALCSAQQRQHASTSATA